MVCEVTIIMFDCYIVHCLNPCFNGIWSASETGEFGLEAQIWLGLNPCFNGIWSARTPSLSRWSLWICLNPCFNGIWSASTSSSIVLKGHLVLILVLMEYGLRAISLMRNQSPPFRCLNPCFNGIWSASIKVFSVENIIGLSLNPCFNGIWSASGVRPPANKNFL